MEPLDASVNKVYNLIRNAELSLDTLDDIVVDLIRITQNIIKDKGKGQYKKRIVMIVLRRLLNDSEHKLSPTTANILATVIETVVPHTIDMLIGVAKGDILIGKSKGIFCCTVT